VISLWFFKQYIHTISRGYVLSSFWKSPSIWSQGSQWIHCDYIKKKTSHGPTGYILKESTDFFMIFYIIYPHHNKWIHAEFFLKVPINLITKWPVDALWSNSKRNQQWTYRIHCKLNHRFLSQFCPKCSHNVPEPLMLISFKKYPPMW
jgi:hypothetical protein